MVEVVMMMTMLTAIKAILWPHTFVTAMEVAMAIVMMKLFGEQFHFGLWYEDNDNDDNSYIKWQISSLILAQNIV